MRPHLQLWIWTVLAIGGTCWAQDAPSIRAKWEMPPSCTPFAPARVEDLKEELRQTGYRLVIAIHPDTGEVVKPENGKKAEIKEVVPVLRKAYEATPTKHDLLFEIAVLTARIPDNAAAKTLFEEYLAKTKGKDPKRDALVETRIKELSLPPK